MNAAEVYHTSVLLTESIDGLCVQGEGIYVDATFGGGGHSREILKRLGRSGRLYSFDQDADAERNFVSDERFTFVRSNFRYLKQWMRYYGVEHLDGLLADLGVSSHHLDDAERGFSFRFDSAPLDMRMNQRSVLTAADVLNSYTEEQLADVFYLYGELRQARRLASEVVKARGQQRLLTSGDLLKVVAPLLSSAGKKGAHSGEKKEAARLFQSLRIEVNHEMEALKELLAGAVALLRPGGRLSVITYHSLEDRIVKNVMRAGNAEGKVTQDFFGRTQAPLRQLGGVITPTEGELLQNPRSRSAKLRVAERI